MVHRTGQCYNIYAHIIMNITNGPDSVPFSLSEAIAVTQETELATGISCTLIDPNGNVLYPVRLRDYPCWLCHLTSGRIPERRVIAGDHADRARDARHLGGVATFLCRSNLMHWVAPIENDGALRGALVGGPVRLADGDSSFEADVIAPFRRVSEVVARAQEASLRAIYDRLPTVCSARIDALASQLRRTADSLVVPDRHEPRTARLKRESRIDEYVQELKRYRHEHEMQAGIPMYPLETEQALLDSIASGDGEQAQAILNELLGHVFFTLGADLERIKIRAREIVVLLSRIVIARGADATRVFGFNYRVLDELDGLDDITEVAHWMARIVRGFAGSVIRVPAAAEHTTILRRVLDYVEDSYRGRVSLGAAAALAGVSSGYLSRVFAGEMGETFSRYVRRLRVRRAQDLLTGTRLAISDIAELCGFTDQSHLTLAFRRETGTTPAAFRKRG